MNQQIGGGGGGDLRVSPVLVTKDGRKMQSVVYAWRRQVESLKESVVKGSRLTTRRINKVYYYILTGDWKV